MSINIRARLIKLLKVYYENFYIIVNNWKEFAAAPFLTTYGVKQGGNMPPELYKIYCEPLAIIVTGMMLGTQIKSVRIDILMYADDIILIATSISDA